MVPDYPLRWVSDGAGSGRFEGRLFTYLAAASARCR
jgi:hypothetical protein